MTHFSQQNHFIAFFLALHCDQTPKFTYECYNKNQTFGASSYVSALTLCVCMCTQAVDSLGTVPFKPVEVVVKKKVPFFPLKVGSLIHQDVLGSLTAVLLWSAMQFGAHPVTFSRACNNKE